MSKDYYLLIYKNVHQELFTITVRAQNEHTVFQWFDETLSTDGYILIKHETRRPTSLLQRILLFMFSVHL